MHYVLPLCRSAGNSNSSVIVGNLTVPRVAASIPFGWVSFFRLLALVFVALFASPFRTARCVAIEPPQKADFNETFELMNDIEFEFSDLTRSIVLELGPVRPMRAYSMQLKLLNESSQDFPIVDIATGCGCVAATADGSTILKKGNHKVDVRIKPSGEGKKWLQRLNILGSSDGSIKPLEIILSAELRPEIKIEKSEYVFDADSVPNLLTCVFESDCDDLDLTQCEVKSLSSRSKVAKILSRSKTEVAVQVDISSVFMDGDNDQVFVLSVHARDARLQGAIKYFEFPVIVRRSGTFEIRPSIITFSRVEDEEFTWRGNLLFVGTPTVPKDNSQKVVIEVSSKDLPDGFAATVEEIDTKKYGYAVGVSVRSKDSVKIPNSFSLTFDVEETSLSCSVKCFVFGSP